MIEYIKSDQFRYYGKTNFITFLKGIIINRTYRFQVYLRMSNSKGFIKYLGLLFYYLSWNHNIYIKPGTKIGYGLYIGHHGPIIVNPTTTIGNNCNLAQFTTIGSNDGQAATIGDNVYIGPGVCIVEDVKIGNNVTIGAGSVVTKDIPNNATAVGNYAKVINYNNPGRYIKNRWVRKEKNNK